MSNAQRLQTRAECACHVPPPLRRFVAVLGSIGFRLLDCFTYLVRHLARRRATGSPRAALAVRGRVVGESWRTRSCSRLAQVEMLWAVVLEQRAQGSRADLFPVLLPSRVRSREVRSAAPPRELRSRGGAPRAGWPAGAARAAGGARSAGFFHARAFRTLREALGRCVRTEGLGLASRETRRSDRRRSDLIFCCSHRRAQGRWTRPTCRPLRARCRS